MKQISVQIRYRIYQANVKGTFEIAKGTLKIHDQSSRKAEAAESKV